METGSGIIAIPVFTCDRAAEQIKTRQNKTEVVFMPEIREKMEAAWKQKSCHQAAFPLIMHG
jgi:hypothetical protein